MKRDYTNNYFLSFAALSIISVLSFLSCDTNKKERPIVLSDLNLIIDSKQDIDSIFISNIGQDREFKFYKFKDTLRVNLNDSINDLYNIWFYAEGKQYSGFNEQIWLNGENIIVKGIFDRGLKLDTIIGSDIHYKMLKNRMDFNILKKANGGKEAVKNLFINQLENNINSPISLDIISNYYYQFADNKSDLSVIFEKIQKQENNLKNHILNKYNSLKTILHQEHINIGAFTFYDRNKIKTKIVLDSKKKYLIDLWFVKCPPCIKDHQLISENLNFLDSKNIEVIGISRDSDNELWNSFLEKKQYAWTNYREIDIHNEKLTTQMYINTFPTYFLINGNGDILDRSHSFELIKSNLDQK